MAKQTALIPAERIERAILLIRRHKVMLDRDLAVLYGVRPIALRQQVKRNQRRFPADFMFQLTPQEAAILVSQAVIPSRKHLGGFLPYAFTEQGVAMLSSVLRSDRAVDVNIAIMAQNQSSCHQPPSGGQDFQRPSNRTPATRV